MLLTDTEMYERCSHAAQARVRRYYNKVDLHRTYRDIYQQHLEMAGALVEA
jgi:hypothetical protein